MKKYTTFFILFVLVLIGATLRFYRLEDQPAGFFCDEAGLTYNAYSILKTGKDNNGILFPFYSSIFSPRGPVAVYDQLPFIAVFGLTEFASRASAATYGILTIVIIYFLTKLITGSVLTGFFAAILTATSPWHIQFSRFGTENIRAPFYFSLALFLFFLGIKKNKKLYILLSLISLFLTFYSYTATNVFIPPFFLGILYVYRKFFLQHKTFFLQLFLLGLLLILPFLHQILFSSQQSRFSEVSVFKDKTQTEAAFEMARTYVLSYSPDFLFVKGDAEIEKHFINRFSVKGVGELFLFTAPFFLVGLYVVCKKRGINEYATLLLWLFLYPIGSVVAGADGGGPFATRSIIGLPVLQIIPAIGISTVYTLIKNTNQKIIYTLSIIFLFSFSLFSYLRLYYVEYPKYSLDFWGWQYGAREITQYFISVENKYDQLVMAPEFNAPEIFLKFYAPDACKKCGIGLPHERIDKNKKQLFAIPPSYIMLRPELSFSIKKTIYYPGGNIAFLIGEVVE